MKVDHKIIKRFESFIEPEPNTGCFLWTGCISRRKDPVGSFGYKGKPIYAHRVSYLINKGPIPNGMCVCHKCDTPACVNPEHLFLGTQLDNIKDRVKKNRSGSARGSSHGHSIFTEEIVMQIFDERISSNSSYAALAKKYNCSRSAIAHVLKRRSWKNVTAKAEDK
jgi:hypothetical protein